MRYTYIASDNTATNGVQLGTIAGKDVVVFGVLFGLPATSKNLWVYDNDAAVYNSTANIAARVSTPATLITGQLPYVVSLPGIAVGATQNAEGTDNGMELGSKGTVITDASQVTVFWDYAS